MARPPRLPPAPSAHDAPPSGRQCRLADPPATPRICVQCTQVEALRDRKILEEERFRMSLDRQIFEDRVLELKAELAKCVTPPTLTVYERVPWTEG